jgi:hypothetical protein
MQQVALHPELQTLMKLQKKVRLICLNKKRIYQRVILLTGVLQAVITGRE